MAAIEDRNKRETGTANGLQGSAKGKELRNNFATDTYELIVKYEDGSVKIQPIDPMAELERRLGLEFEIKTSL